MGWEFPHMGALVAALPQSYCPRYLLKLLSAGCWLDFPGDTSELCRRPGRRLSVSRRDLLSPSERGPGISRNSLSLHMPTVPSWAW